MADRGGITAVSAVRRQTSFRPSIGHNLKVSRVDASDMRIYTGRGDAGETDLRDQTRVSKADPRIEAYGTVDELNALLGTILPTGHGDVDEHLEQIQQDLHVIQAELADPDGDGDPAISASHIERLEAWMDDVDEELPPLTKFILPGGSTGGASLHHARTVCRRAERHTVALADAEDGAIDDPIVYLNRLSDALFVLARLVNAREGFEESNPTY